ncbi:MAG: hypothetical protein KGV59_02430 [Tenacibaculum sp.]|nr:hypothetical protein [Tenacibaculum sp.]
MKYYAKKWTKFNFIVHPTELENIFKELNYFIIPSTRVSIDYKLTDIDNTSIFKEYGEFYEKVISGKDLGNDKKIIIVTRLTNNLNLIELEPFEIEEGNKIKKFKRVLISEFMVNIGTFSFMAYPKDKLTTAYCDNTGKSDLGLQISYPKEIICLDDNKIIKLDEFKTYELYSEIVKKIKKISRRVKAIRNGIEIKPNFWITEKVLKDINNNLYLRENDIILK